MRESRQSGQETGKMYKGITMATPFAKLTKTRKSTTKQGQTTESYQTKSEEPTHEQIAARAFEIYLRNGCRPGEDEQNWLQAEKELRQGI